ncbi:wax ester/triacylglycerol synthase family O-acyltransferase [Desulfosarcina ovata]|nr:wax ester/triacylglycerol synthase family O-acyltransferase [Desulfosarcina ovata]
MKQLTGADEMWFSLESQNTPMHISDVHIYNPVTAPGKHVSQKDVLNYIEKRVDSLPMREKRFPVPFNADYSYWVDDENFDLKNHIRFTTLSKPGTWKQFCSEVERIIAIPLDMSRPLWEMHIIEGLNKIDGIPEGCFAVVHKKHHGQFDGSSATYVKSVLHTLDPAAKELPPKQTTPADKAPSQLDLFYRTMFRNTVIKPMERMNFLYRTLPDLPQAMQAAVEDAMKMGSAVRTRFSKAIPSLSRVIEARPFPLQDILRFRKLVPGATVNDVVITIFAGALRKYLMHHNELPEEPLRGLIPIAVRKEEEIGAGGNKVFSMITVTHTDVEDPVERLAKVHQATQYSKKFTDTLGGRSMNEMLELSPLAMIDLSIKMAQGVKLANFNSPLYSGFGMSNVPGSRESLYFCGAQQIRCFNWGFLMDGMGLLLAAGSYGDELVFSTMSCPEMMPDSDFFADCIQKSHDELYHLKNG